MTADEPRNCTRCGELLAADAFHFVTRATGKRRGQCRSCMGEVKAAQKDPSWLPTCSQCARLRPRSGPGRRLCEECFSAKYDEENRRVNGSHRLKLNPCSACGTIRLRADHFLGSQLCPICRSVPQPRRTKLKRFFGLNPREYLALLAAQGDSCAICLRHVRAGSPLHVDHSHGDPPIIRGIVCNTCNAMLGMARDSAVRLRAAAAYLDAPPAQVVLPGRVATVAGSHREYHRLARVSRWSTLERVESYYAKDLERAALASEA